MAKQSDILKAMQIFTTKWVKNMKELVPVRSGDLKDSIRSIDRPEPIIGMLYYGQYVDQGTRYIRGSSITPFIGDGFDKAFKEVGDEFSDEVYKQIEKQFDKAFKK